MLQEYFTEKISRVIVSLNYRKHLLCSSKQYLRYELKTVFTPGHIKKILKKGSKNEQERNLLAAVKNTKRMQHQIPIEYSMGIQCRRGVLHLIIPGQLVGNERCRQ